MNRFPSGAGTRGFWHKQLPDHAPDWMPRWDRPDAERGQGHHLPGRRRARGAGVGGQLRRAGVARLDRARGRPRTAPRTRSSTSIPARPPPGTTCWSWPGCTGRRWSIWASAASPRSPAGAASRSGSRSPPVPASPKTTAWVEQLSRAVGEVVPELVSWKWELRDRSGHARLDYTQNAGHKTLVAPYSPRPLAGAPVSAPDRLGRAGRSRPAAGQLHDPEHLRPAGRTGRPVPAGPGHHPGPAAHQLSHPEDAGSALSAELP